MLVHRARSLETMMPARWPASYRENAPPDDSLHHAAARSAQRLLLSCHLVGTLNTVYFARAMPREVCDRVRQQARRALLRIFMMRLVRESVSVSAQSHVAAYWHDLSAHASGCFLHVCVRR